MLRFTTIASAAMLFGCNANGNPLSPMSLTQTTLSLFLLATVLALFFFLLNMTAGLDTMRTAHKNRLLKTLPIAAAAFLALLGSHMLADATDQRAQFSVPETDTRPNYIPPQSSVGPEGAEQRIAGRTQLLHTTTHPTSNMSLLVRPDSYHAAITSAIAQQPVDPTSVRPEEWLNAFDYAYPPHHDQSYFGIHSNITDHPLDENLKLLRLAFQAPELTFTEPRLNVTIAIDSGPSMNINDKAATAQAAAHAIADGLDHEDILSIVRFSDVIHGEAIVTAETPDTPTIRTAIDTLPHTTDSDAQLGLDEAITIALHQASQTKDGKNVIILLTDNPDGFHPTDPLRSVPPRDPYTRPPTLTLVTIGIGMEHSPILEQLSDELNGYTLYLPNPSAAAHAMSNSRWINAGRPFARELSLEVNFNHRTVKSWRLIGFEVPIDTIEQNPTDTYFPDMNVLANQSITVFYEITPTMDRNLSLGRVDLSWIQHADNKSREQRHIVSQRASTLANHHEQKLLFASLVALTADRHSAADNTQPSTDLTILNELMQQLAAAGANPQYAAFAALTQYLTSDIPSQPPTAPPSR